MKSRSTNTTAETAGGMWAMAILRCDIVGNGSIATPDGAGKEQWIQSSKAGVAGREKQSI